LAADNQLGAWHPNEHGIFFATSSLMIQYLALSSV
jgi:hypothetical protein